jgi:hypothetical protein
VRLAVSVSRPLRANHRLPDLAGLVDGAGWVSVGLGLTDVVAAVVAAQSDLIGALGAVAAVLGLFCAAVWAALGLAGVVDEAGWLTAEPVLTEPAPAGVFAGRGLVEAGTSLASGLASLAREAG